MRATGNNTDYNAHDYFCHNGRWDFAIGTVQKNRFVVVHRAKNLLNVSAAKT